MTITFWENSIIFLTYDNEIVIAQISKNNMILLQ